MGKKHKHLTAASRLEIYRLQEEKLSLNQIALAIGYHKSTISRELRRNGCPLGYLPDRAQIIAYDRRNCRGSKIERSTDLQNLIRDYLLKGWSPEAIAGRLKVEGSCLSISHESIYQWIYGPGRGLNLHKNLVRCKRKRGIRPCRKATSSKISQRLSIHERPKEQQESFGVWEGDTVIFARNKGAIVTLYERVSKITLAKKVKSKKATLVQEALLGMIAELPESARISITFDNGLEFSDHAKLRPYLTDTTYFCDPYASWQKGGVENANGILRRDIPKGSSEADYNKQDIEDILSKINNTPRKSLGFLTPIEKFNALVFQVEPVISNLINSVAFRL